MEIAAGAIRIYMLFDVADSIDLQALRTVEGEGLAPAHLPLRPHKSSAPLQFPVPPLVARLADASVSGLPCNVRVKLFDYGVISIRLTFALRGALESVFDLLERLQEREPAARYAQEVVTRLCAEIGNALDDPHTPLVEDYTIIEIDRFTENIDGDTLLKEHGRTVAALVLGERSALAQSEIEETLRMRFSYLADDLTIVQWDTAFVYDRAESADAISEILEFANSQLLELRTYDAQLDAELDEIYKAEPGGAAPRSLLGRREAERAATLRYTIVDVLEIIDRSSNALKIVGDAYYARIYRAASSRLGLADWQRQVDSKLASIGEMYRFYVDRLRSRRDEFLEIIIIVLIALELVVAVATLLRR